MEVTVTANQVVSWHQSRQILHTQFVADRLFVSLGNVMILLRDNCFEKRVSDYRKASVRINSAPSRKSECAGSSGSVTTEWEPAASKPFSLDEDLKWLVSLSTHHVFILFVLAPCIGSERV